MEGEAEIAAKQAHFADDGVIDKHEQKEIDKAHKRQLESRGRGPAQIRAYRTSKWMMRVSRNLDVAVHCADAASGDQGQDPNRQGQDA